jgi:hypothetical protein
MRKLFLHLFVFFSIASGLPQDLSAANEDKDSSVVNVHFGGHLKYQFIYMGYPQNSIFREALGAQALDHSLEARLDMSVTRNQWDFKADYQFIALYSDTLSLASGLPGSALPVNSVISDSRRWWDLTYSSSDDDKSAIIHRLDRLSVGFTTDNSAWRFGRQAISWGNGMVFTPMDVFNPFDPATVDKEYKTGDDMLYGQHLFNSGHDLQTTLIVRRDLHSGDVEREQSSLAFKYHGFLGMNEYDLLAAEHYDDQILGIGGIVSIGGAVLRGDLTWTDTQRESVWSVVSSLSYSWTWGGKNISGLLEYYYNGFGQTDSAYSGSDLQQNPDLLKRLGRGELFTLARNYLAASATVEMTPLFMFIPNVFINLEDPSALAQFVASYSLKQEIQVLAALNLPIGSDGSEYGGIESPVDGLYFSTGPSFFAQLAWYF